MALFQLQIGQDTSCKTGVSLYHDYNFQVYVIHHVTCKTDILNLFNIAKIHVFGFATPGLDIRNLIKF